MSYSLFLHFKPRIRRTNMVAYFAGRRHYKLAKDRVSYQNEDTGVYFWFDLRYGRDILGRRTVKSIEFEVNYNRPSFFALEAEKELSAIIGVFHPRIEDPQMHGMGEGPYSAEGFFSGWNFGNAFSVRSVLTRSPDADVTSMPGDVLRAAWLWNSRCAEQRKKLNHRCFVPTILFLRVDGLPCRVVAWGAAMPIMLPRVDYVVVGRPVMGDKRFGLVPWSEVLDVASRAGFDTSSDPIELIYFVAPALIKEWAANIPLVELKTYERLPVYRILDDELIAAAHRSIERDRGSPDGSWTLE